MVGLSGSLPILNEVVCGAAVLPNAVRDESDQQIIWTGAVEVFGADNERRALFPPSGCVKAWEVDIDYHPACMPHRHVVPPGY